MTLMPSGGSRGRGFNRARRAVAAGFAAATVPVALAVSGGPAAVISAQHSAPARSCPWLNQSLPVSKRVSLLMARMTLADKISFVTGPEASQPDPALCYPGMSLEDGPGGAGDGLTGVTQLPAPVSLAATWDASLATVYGQVVGAEERGKGETVSLGPTVRRRRWQLLRHRSVQRYPAAGDRGCCRPRYHGDLHPGPAR
jgi:beta-glucosidase